MYEKNTHTHPKEDNNCVFSERILLHDVQINAQRNNVKVSFDAAYRPLSRYVISRSLRSKKRRPCVTTISTCDLLSAAKAFVGFSRNSVYEFFTKGCQSSVSFVKIGGVQPILHLWA
jgi:hypothetical protein